MSRKLLRSSFALGLCIFLLCGCNSGIGKDTENKEKKFTIVTSFYPIYVTVLNIVKDAPDVELINMTEPQTGCLHDYQLSPKDLKTLEKADVFIINGAGMEAFLSDIIKQQKDLKIIEASRGIETIKNENGDENPHVWVSISNAIKQTENISEQLSVLNAANKAVYTDNAATYMDKLENLKVQAHTALDSIKNRNIITFHEAFPYFAKEFNLNIAAVIEREPGTAPSPQELEKVISVIKEKKVYALFVEPQYPSNAADTIAKETGAKLYPLDPVVTGEANVDAYDKYINTMKINIESLKEALNG